MTIAPNPESSPIDNTWMNQDTAQRLATLEQLDPNLPSDAKFLSKIALEDEHEQVRISALSKISNFDILEELMSSSSEMKHSAEQQISRIIAGTLESDYSEQRRVEKLMELDQSAIKQIALITKLKAIGTLAVNRISAAEDLADLCYFASSVHVRKSAALRIEDEVLLKEVYSKLQKKDKSVSKLIGSRLGIESTPSTKKIISQNEPKPFKKLVESLNNEDKTKQAASGAEPADTKSIKAKKAKSGSVEEAKAPTSAASFVKNSSMGSNRESQAASLEAVKETVIVTKKEIDQLASETKKLSFKNTSRLFELRSQLRRFKPRIEVSDEALRDNCQALLDELEEKIAKNNAYQEDIQQKTKDLLLELAAALESGNSEDAAQCWDKIQGNISNTSNQIRAELQSKAKEYKAKITELRDWKIFASTEKRKN